MENILYLIICVIFAACGGVLYRWRGGGEPAGLTRYMPRPVDQILFSLPYIFMAFMVLDDWTAGVVSIITVIMVSRGHGRNMDLGTFDNSTSVEAGEPEWYEGLIGSLHGKIPEYWYDALGLMISGLTYTIPIGLMMASPFGNYLYEGLIVCLSGALKAPAYMLGRYFVEAYPGEADISEYEIYKILPLKIPTQWGEFLTGYFLWFIAGGVLISLVL